MPTKEHTPSAQGSDEDSSSEDEAIQTNPIWADEIKQRGLTEKELHILQSFRTEWQKKKGAERTKVAEKAYKKMLQNNPSLVKDKAKAGKEARQKKRQAIQWWFHTFGRTRKSKEKFHYVKRWNYRMVISQRYGHLHAEAIQDLAGKTSPGSREYMRHYQHALSKLMARLSPDDIDDAKETAKRWNTLGPPPDIQAKTAHKHGSKYIREFCVQMKRSCGMDCVVLAFHKNMAGATEAAAHEYMGELGGKSFFQAVPNWQEVPVMNAFLEHGKELHNADMQVVSSRARSLLKKRPLIALDVDASGYPVLPGELDPDMKLADQKHMIRSLLVQAYRKDSKNPAAIFPWGDFSRSPESYVGPEFLPADMSIGEPSHLKAENVTGLLQHWLDRQADGEVPVMFHHVQSHGQLVLVGDVKRDITGRNKKCDQTSPDDSEWEDICEDAPGLHSIGDDSGPMVPRPALVSKAKAGPGRSSVGCTRAKDPKHPVTSPDKSQGPKRPRRHTPGSKGESKKTVRFEETAHDPPDSAATSGHASSSLFEQPKQTNRLLPYVLLQSKSRSVPSGSIKSSPPRRSPSQKRPRSPVSPPATVRRSPRKR